jgi:hypothetical protein
MRPRSKAGPAAASEPETRAGRRPWLLFVHQLPSNPSNLRVRTWRRLQQLGAIPIKQAVYVLPDTPGAREDFEWLKTEVTGAGGDASVFAAESVDAWSDDALIDEFRQSREAVYLGLARDVEKTLKRASKTRPSQGSRAPAIERLLSIFRERLAAIEKIDFFGSSGRDRVTALLQQLEHRSSARRAAPVAAQSAASVDVNAYRRRLWVTRPRPGVDRMASAWLIRRFIDPQAKFDFAADRDAVPASAVPFDMFGVEFSHQGDGCTFETLCTTFSIRGPAIARIAAIVHDLDLKDERFDALDAPTVGAMIEGLQLAHGDDETLLAQGMTLFESLYRAFDQSARAAVPRQVGRAKMHKIRTPLER